MKRSVLTVVLLLAGTMSCTFHSTANRFNGLVGANGKPVYVKSTTNVGVNLGIILGLLGNTEINTMVDSLTSDIASEGGNVVRIIESSTENYWYGFPPFTWILTPVISTVTADYEPSKQKMAEDKAAAMAEAAAK